MKILLKYSILLLTTGLLLNSCTIWVSFFVRNFSSDRIRMQIKLDEDIDSLRNIESNLVMKYSNSILEINDDTENITTVKLPYKELDHFNIVFSLPPKSTLFVGGNYNVLSQFSEFIVMQDSRVDTIKIGDTSKIESSGGITPIQFYYDYKN